MRVLIDQFEGLRLRFILVLLIAAFLAFSLSAEAGSEAVDATAQAPTAKRVELVAGNSSRFSLDLPSDWNASIFGPPGINAPTLSAQPIHNNVSALLVTFLPIQQQNDTPERLLAKVLSRIMREHANDPNSKRTDLVPLASSMSEGIGGLFSYKDESLAALDQLPDGEYIYLTVGAMVIGDVMVNFSVFTNDIESPGFKMALTGVVEMTRQAN